MANFKGGFAFNNEAAKVEVEQAPDGTLISCVNPVTGESLNAGNSKEVITGTLAAPFGDHVIEDLISGFQLNNISGEIIVDGSSLGFSDHIRLPLSYNRAGTSLAAEEATISSSAVDLAIAASWASGGGTQLRVYMNNTVVSLPGILPTEVKLYHHPMP